MTEDTSPLLSTSRLQTDHNSNNSSIKSSSQNSPVMEEDSSLEERPRKMAKKDQDAEKYLLHDSPMPVTGFTFVPTDFNIKLEAPSPERHSQSSVDLSGDLPFSSKVLPPVSSSLQSPHIGEEGISAFSKTVPKNVSEHQKQLSLIKLSQIKSAFSSRTSANGPTSIGQMFALKKRIKQAQLNGDSSLSNTSLSPISGVEGVTCSPGKEDSMDSRDASSPARRPDGKVGIITYYVLS